MNNEKPTTIRCLAVDDEPLALDLLEDNIAKIPFLKLVGLCGNAFEAHDMLDTAAIDLIFLDIQMPGLTGVQFLKSLTKHKPMTIFITAYSKFALEGYALDVLDYLVKPVSFSRFEQACNKAKDLFELKNAQIQLLDVLAKTENREEIRATELPEFFFVNADYNHVKINFSDITHIESMKDYLKIFLITQPKPVITRMTLKAMEEKLTDYDFLRVHKSYIVSIPYIESFKAGFVLVNKRLIPFSESYKEALIKLRSK